MVTPNERLIRIAELQKKLGDMSAAAIWAGVKAGTIPEPVRLGPRFTAWPLSQVDAWLAKRISASQRKA